MKKIKKDKMGRSPRLGIVVSHFNEFITQRLLDGCLDELGKLGVRQRNIQVVWVPGSFEIPVTALKLARQKSIAAVICLGAVIRGETYHFEMVAQGATQGILQAGLITGKPIIFGVLTTNTTQQAYARCDDKKEHKGRDAARAALDMIKTLGKI
jgi:6,7-dimethyl-8-ribityllumazine synthase